MDGPAKTERPVRRAVLAGGLATSLAALAPAAPPAPQGVAILAYHRFDPRTAGPTTVTVKAFEAQLSWLSRRRYRIAPLRDAVADLGRASPTAAITVDDGHRSVYSVLFPLVLSRRIPITLFIYPSAISNAGYAMTWEHIREMLASGLVEAQSHTYWHPNFKTERRRRTPAEFKALVGVQLRRSREILQTRLGKPVDMLAWPFGIVDPELELAATEAGYRYGFAYEGGLARPGADPMALPRIPVTDAHRGDRFGELLTGARPAAPS